MDEESAGISLGGRECEISNAVINELAKYGVEVDGAYLESLMEWSNPFLDIDMERLVWQDMRNRQLYDRESGLGHIVAYLGKETKDYPNLYEAILDNWDERPEMGFERLHAKGIDPIPHVIERFGVASKVRYQDMELRRLNEHVRDIYRYKGGVSWRRLYGDYLSRDRRDGEEPLEFDDFLHRMAKSFSFSLGDLVVFSLMWQRREREKAKARSDADYLWALARLLDRYSADGETAFVEVDDLNEFDSCSGVYVLGIDAERRHYVGMTTASFKERILDHFRRPNSDFDRSHTFADVDSIHVLCVDDEDPYAVDRVEADCIATIGSEYVFNSEAASMRLVEKIALDGSWAEVTDSPVRASFVQSKDYVPDLFTMSVTEAEGFARDAEKARLRFRKRAEDARRSRPTSEEINDFIVEHRGVMTQREMARELGITVKAVEHRVSRLRSAGRIPTR